MFNRTIKTIAVIMLIIASAGSLYAKEVWQWTDKEGTTHITDNKAKIPEQYRETAKNLNWNDSSNNENVFKDTLDADDTVIITIEEEPYVDGIIDTEHEAELREEWRAKMVAIEQEQAEVESKLAQATEDQKYKKREVDWYLRNGYPADYMIAELKGIERYIEDLEEELTTIPPKIDALQIEARKAGVPPGYLRE
ncbi:MAG TPA: DUF4124 domain-containing protein [Thermodesulfobacteriota bacterium]|nr:DUF4124 domain-containing protein [Thermodesulfobacteriota bacterium]